MLKVNMAFLEKTGEITGYSSTDQTNTSRLDKLSVPSAGAKLFYLSEDPDNVTSPLDGQHLWADDAVGYSGWVSSTYSDANGEFASGSEPTIVVTGESIEYLVLYPDIVENQYIMQVEVDGLLYNGDSERLVIVLGVPTTQVNIKVKKLNNPYQPVRVTAIDLGLSIDFTDDDIVDYNVGAQSQSDDDGIQYSVISRFGSVVLHNRENMFENLNDLDLLQKTVPIKIYIGNKQFGEYLLQDANLQIDSASASFNLTDKLINLDQINWRKDYYLEEEKDAKTFIDFIMNYIGEEYVFFDSSTEQIYTNTILTSAIIDTSNVKTVLNKLCEVTSSCIFINNQGKICIKYLENTSEEVSNDI